MFIRYGLIFITYQLSVLLVLLTALSIGLITDNIIQSALMNRYLNTSVEQLRAVDEAVKIFQGDVDNDIRMFANNSLVLKANAEREWKLSTMQE